MEQDGNGAAEDTPLLRVEDLRTSFGTARGTVRAVDGVTLELRRGETLGIVGESGSGKSVLVRTIMNLVGTDPNARVSGRVLFEGRDVHQLPKSERRHFYGTEMAMVFQDPMTSLNPVKRIGTHLTESVRFHLGLDRAAARQRALELLTKVGIPDPEGRLRQYPHELSGGMRQRVVIAMALACSPKLLVADEPTTALDVTVQRQILDLIARLTAETGMSTILISHDLGVVAGRTDRIAVMYAGRVVETAPTQELFARMRHPYSEALLESVPRMDQPVHTLLPTIPGRPPDLTALPAGCNFRARCRYVVEKCESVDPSLERIEMVDHHVACHVGVGTPAGIAARARNEDRVRQADSAATGATAATGASAAALPAHAVEVA